MGLTGLHFSINIAEKKTKPRPKKEGIDRVLTKRVIGVITQSNDGNAYCRVTCHDRENNPIDGAFPFTKDSYDIKGREIVFKKGLDNKGRKICIIREVERAKHSANDTDHYTSVRHNWICDGNVVLKDGKKYFRLHKVIKPYNNITDNINND